MAKNLTTKQELFCVAYASHGNGTQSYKEAGYAVSNDKVADANARKLLANRRIIDRINELKHEIITPRIMDAAERRETLSAIARDADAAKNERIKAIDVLNKMDAIYIQRQEISGAVPVVIVDDVPEDD